MKELFHLREEYTKGALLESDVPPTPLPLFEKWFDDAVKADIIEPNTMVLTTATLQGIPSSRIVLLKEVRKEGFVFFTNYHSRKGRQIEQNPHVSVVFDWHEAQHQVRIEGVAKKISAQDSDIYFRSRPQSSQIGAWVSPQSQELTNRQEIDERLKENIKRFEGKEIPRPPHWGGYLIHPTYIEFWQGRANRLHDRVVYTLESPDNWKISRLAP